MSDHFDLLEVRSEDQRTSEQFAELRRILGFARGHAAGIEVQLENVDTDGLVDRAALAALPVLRKSELTSLQAEAPPFGELTTRKPAHNPLIFMSPGPIFEPGGEARDWWRLGRFLHAAGLRMGDIIHNCFSYHLTPAGHMIESAVAAISATCVPAGTGQSELQVEAAHRIGCTAYAGTPDFLKVILEKSDELGKPLSFTKAVVSGGALFSSLRQFYQDRGIRCFQAYATADLGNVAYESATMEGMIVDEGVIVEIVRPGTGDPVPEGEVGEVVVTALNTDYPLVRFATGDLSAVLPGQSACGRTNMRIKGWMGRADQTTKVKGMFVRPEQVAQIARRHPELARLRLVVARAEEADVLRLVAETEAADADAVVVTLSEVLKLRGTVDLVTPGTLPNDGIVIEDQRSYD
ncbi:MAG: AMP-binding protein [Pseudomonadota bacterium]